MQNISPQREICNLRGRFPPIKDDRNQLSFPAHRLMLRYDLPPSRARLIAELAGYHEVQT